MEKIIQKDNGQKITTRHFTKKQMQMANKYM